MAQPTLSSKRISVLTEMSSSDITAELENKETAAEWVIAIDSLRRSNEADRPDGSGLVEGEDGGTLRVPVSRLALRDEAHGLIPSSMLPSHIDDIVFGTLTVNTSNGLAMFEETPPAGSTNIRVYVSPENKRTTGQYEPSENVIYFDNDTRMQYRYNKANQYNPLVNYGFAEIPGSRSIVPGYGINITMPTSSAAETIVSAKTPKQYYGYSSESFVINGVYTGFGYVIDEYTNGLTLESTSNGFTVNHMVDPNDHLGDEHVAYHIDIELKCSPYPRTENIITLSVSGNDKIYSSATYDMSSVATENDNPDIVVFSFDVDTNEPWMSFYLIGEDDNSVLAKLTRISIVELI